MEIQLFKLAAALIVKLAYLISGLVVCFIGKTMLEKGISADFFGEGQTSTHKLRIVTSSPGIVFLLCGLAIILLGIDHPTEVTEEGGVRLAHTTSKTADEPDIEALLEKIEVSRFAQSDETVSIANKYLDLSLKEVGEGKDEQAIDDLVRAGALDPSLIATMFDSPALERLRRDQNFQNFVRARLVIYFKTVGENVPLSLEGKGLLNRLRLYASLGHHSPGGNSSEVMTLNALLAKREDTVQLRQKLNLLIERDPKSALTLLSSSENSWVLNNQDLNFAISKTLDRLFKK